MILVAAIVLALALAMSACSGDPEQTASGPRGAGISAAEPATSAEAAARQLSAPLTPTWTSSIEPPTMITADLLVHLDGREMSAASAATGEEFPQVRLPGSLGDVCSTSPRLSDGHVLGLLLRAKGQPCTIATAVDLTTGTVLWHRVLPGKGRYHEGRSVAVSDDVLLATLNCDEVRRLSIDDGRLLSVIAPGDPKCGNETATDGDLVAVLADPETAETPDDHGTGFIPPSDATGAFELYDADTGRRLWRHPIANTRGAGVTGVVSSDPVVLTTTEGSHTTTRLWDRGGRPGPVIGFAPDDLDGLTVVGRTADVLVATYPDAEPTPVYFGYDLRTGQELWRFTAPAPVGPRALVAVDGDSLLVAYASSQGTFLLRYPWTADSGPRDAELVGLVPDSTVAGLSGSRLLTSALGQTGVSAYDAPATGTPITEDVIGATLVSALDASWQEDDVRPEEAAYACTTVSPATLRLAGLDWSGLPAPADCRWRETARPTYLNRELDVTVSAIGPSYSDGRVVPASDTAQDYAEKAAGHGDTYAEGRPLPQLDTNHRLGDAAWGWFAGSGDSFDGFPVRMVTRWHNVVIDVTANQAAELETRLVDAAPFSQLQDAVYAATSDVLRSVGADVAAVPAGPDGPVDEVADSCRTLRTLGARLVPGTEAYAGQPTDRHSACLWSAEDRQLTVLAYAVPGGADGTPAEARASEVAAILPGGNARGSVAGVPGTSVYSVFNTSGGDYKARTLTTYVDNLVAWVDLTISDGAPPADEVDAEVARIARTLVRANT